MAVVVVGVVAVVVTAGDGNAGLAVVLLGVVALFGWWSWPGRRGPHRNHAEAQATAGDDDVIVYWRPG